MELDGLRCFVALARHTDASRAAQALGVSTAELRRAIAALERSLDRPLFEQAGDSATLTPDGRRLSPHAALCVEEADRCLDLFRETKVDHGRYELMIGTRFELGMSWLVPLLDDLRKNVPDRSIGLSFADGPELLRRLEAGEVDGMISSMRVESRTELASAQLHLERYAFVGAPSLLRTTPLREPRDTERHTLLDISPARPLFRYFSAAQSESAWTFAQTEHLGTIAAIRARMLAGAGVGVLPLYFIRGDITDGSLVAVMPRRRLETDTFSLTWRSGNPQARALNALVSELKLHPLK